MHTSHDRRTTRLVTVIVLVASLIAGSIILLPGVALGSTAHSQETTHRVFTLVSNEPGLELERRVLSEDPPIVQVGMLKHKSLNVEIASGHPGKSTDWTVGIGSGIYLYLNAGDVATIRAVGYTAAVALICGWLGTVAFPAGVTCSIVAAGVYEIVVDNYFNVPDGYCVEIKWPWIGAPGHKLVKRSC